MFFQKRAARSLCCRGVFEHRRVLGRGFVVLWGGRGMKVSGSTRNGEWVSSWTTPCPDMKGEWMHGILEHEGVIWATAREWSFRGDRSEELGRERVCRRTGGRREEREDFTAEGKRGEHGGKDVSWHERGELLKKTVAGRRGPFLLGCDKGCVSYRPMSVLSASDLPFCST